MQLDREFSQETKHGNINSQYQWLLYIVATICLFIG